MHAHLRYPVQHITITEYTRNTGLQPEQAHLQRMSETGSIKFGDARPCRRIVVELAKECVPLDVDPELSMVTVHLSAKSNHMMFLGRPLNTC
jgi:hypothetical protein